jgi:thioredoxin 1
MRGYDVASLRGAEWLVVCLCAEWCGSCRDYRPGFEALAAAFPDVAFAWFDVEAEADVAGDYDVENFPTLLIERGDRVLFYGTLLPHTIHLRRLIETFREQTPDASRAYAQATEERRGWEALDIRKRLG